MRLPFGAALLCALLLCGAVSAGEGLEDLRGEVARLRKDIAEREKKAPALNSKVDSLLSSKYGPNAEVTTRTGKLQIGGLLQVWYQSIRNDHVGVVTAAPGNAIDPSPGAGFLGGTPPEPNELLDNDTFRVRRTELRFAVDVHENITGYVMIDPTREANTSFTPIPTFPQHNGVLTNPNLTSLSGGQQGGQLIIPQILQDAYINYHDVIPHHDITIGQFKPPSGEESWRNSGQLDFVDRAMVTSINNVRDIGIMIHGTWFENRLQYWVGGFNGPDGTVLTDPELVEGGNRSDDNDAKDFAWRIAGRPIWDTERWRGRLEMGYARTDGYRGEAGEGYDAGLASFAAINGLARTPTAINRQAAWAWYRPNGPVKGWWFRGEWGSGHDRYSVRTPTALLGAGQFDPLPVTVSGWYTSTGYRMSDSIFAKDCKGAFGSILKNMEFAFRYEVYQNVVAEDLVNPSRQSDLFKTQAYTAGINYYIKGHDLKIQANYIFVDDPSSANTNRGLREVNNNVFVINFQTMF